MVHTITDDSFQTEVADSNIPCLILFTADWCTYCHDLVPVMEELSQQLEGKVKFCTVDIDKQRKLRIMFAVGALPFIVYIDQGMRTPLFDEIVTKERLEERINYMLDGGKSPTTTPLGKMR